MSDQTSCVICGTSPTSFAWTDTHGVAQCWTCGAPYRLYHYDEHTNARIEKPPTCCVFEQYIPILKTYWQTFQKRIPGGHSSPGGQELTTSEEQEHFYEWLELNKPVGEAAP